jgi:crotonobetainyl-CoA:carnitine CoA-transferase CaiB-like acyl-CoA transferase
MALDIREPEALSIVHQLAAKADVVVASYKPGDAEKLGVDEHTLRSLNPRLIYAQITGYGLDDPRAGYDAVIQAESGFQCVATSVLCSASYSSCRSVDKRSLSAACLSERLAIAVA